MRLENDAQEDSKDALGIIATFTRERGVSVEKRGEGDCDGARERGAVTQLQRVVEQILPRNSTTAVTHATGMRNQLRLP